MKKVKRLLLLNAVMNFMVLACCLVAYITHHNEVITDAVCSCLLGAEVVFSGIAIYCMLKTFFKVKHTTAKGQATLEFFRCGNAIVFGWMAGTFILSLSCPETINVSVLCCIVTSGIGTIVAIIAYFVAGKIAKRSFRIEETLA